jgi:hypothetical protein
VDIEGAPQPPLPEILPEPSIAEILAEPDLEEAGAATGPISVKGYPDEE